MDGYSRSNNSFFLFHIKCDNLFLYLFLHLLSHIYVLDIEFCIIDVCQVKLNELQEYLASMRDEGYIIVGLEQTLKSRTLSSYKFHHKTVLVLG